MTTTIEYPSGPSYTRRPFKLAREFLYDPVWTIGRTVDKDYTASRYVVPSGSTIMMSQYIMHRDPRYYDEPDRFDPERWSSEAHAI